MYGTTSEMSTITIDRGTHKLWIKQGGDKWDEEGIALAVERVNLGAAMLDERNPSWMERIIPEKLNMSSATFCIIGQSCGDYDEWVAVAFGMAEEPSLFDSTQSDPPAIEHGFLEDRVVPFGLLDRVWVYLLQERQHIGARVLLEVPA